MNFTRVAPCDECPFRLDRAGMLSPERVWHLASGLVRNAFPCHKSLNYAGLGDDALPAVPADAEHCAGALIMLEAIGQPSQVMRRAKQEGRYDPNRLCRTAAVYDSFDAMAYLHGLCYQADAPN